MAHCVAEDMCECLYNTQVCKTEVTHAWAEGLAWGIPFCLVKTVQRVFCLNGDRITSRSKCASANQKQSSHQKVLFHILERGYFLFLGQSITNLTS